MSARIDPIVADPQSVIATAFRIESGDMILTVGQIAKAFGVAPRTVQGWCDRHNLSHYRIPGSQDRRIRGSDLFEFFRRFEIDALWLLPRVVLCVGLSAADRVTVENVGPSIRMVEAGSLFRAGQLIERFRPSVVVFDGSLGPYACLEPIRLLLTWVYPPPMAILLPEDRSLAPDVDGQVTIFQQPLRAGVLADWVLSSLRRRSFQKDYTNGTLQESRANQG